jgi:hypothetical protein
MKRIVLLLLLVAAVLVSVFILRRRAKQTKIEPANVSQEDRAAMVAAVYRTRRRTNGLSVYYVEKYSRGRVSWYHVLFNDENERQAGIHPVFDLELTAEGWQVVNKRDE